MRAPTWCALAVVVHAVYNDVEDVPQPPTGAENLPQAPRNAPFFKADELDYEVILFNTTGDWIPTAMPRLMGTGVEKKPALALLHQVRREGKARVAKCPLEICIKFQKLFLEIGMKADVQKDTDETTEEERQERRICANEHCWGFILKDRADKNRLVTLAFVNRGFVPFCYNLKCSLNLARVRNEILIGADRATCKEAVKMDDTKCVVGNPLFFDDKLHAGVHSMGTEEYASIVRLKTRPVISALELGFSVLFTDVDILWVSDPRPWLVLKMGMKSLNEPLEPKLKKKKKKSSRNWEAEDIYERPRLDALVQSDHDPSNDGPCNDGRDCKRSFRCARKEHESGRCAAEACSGFYLLRAGEPAIGFVKRVQELITMQSDKRSTEQWAFNVALGENGGARGDLNWKMLPLAKFPNGAHYFTHGTKLKDGKQPFIVHNNWIQGGAAKERRFRDNGMWLVGGSPARPSCKVPQNAYAGGMPGAKPNLKLSREDLKRGYKNFAPEEMEGMLQYEKDEL